MSWKFKNRKPAIKAIVRDSEMTASEQASWDRAKASALSEAACFAIYDLKQAANRPGGKVRSAGRFTNDNLPWGESFDI